MEICQLLATLVIIFFIWYILFVRVESFNYYGYYNHSNLYPKYKYYEKPYRWFYGPGYYKESALGKDSWLYRSSNVYDLPRWI